MYTVLANPTNVVGSICGPQEGILLKSYNPDSTQNQPKKTRLFRWCLDFEAVWTAKAPHLAARWRR
jgi:hypothetical protein